MMKTPRYERVSITLGDRNIAQLTLCRWPTAKHTYVRFNVVGIAGAVESATLRMY